MSCGRIHRDDALAVELGRRERVYRLIVIDKVTTQKSFAEGSGLSTGHVSRLVRVWQWWLENGSGADHGYVERPDAIVDRRAGQMAGLR